MLKFSMIALLLILTFSKANSQALNTLSAAEKKDGWKLLFDGKDLSGWHGYGGKEVGSAWIIEEGAIKLNVPERAGNKAKNGGDIVIDDKIYDGARENTHRASDFFGIANARLREGKPQGEWNKIDFIVKKGKLTVYQDEFIVQEHDLNSADWKQKVANSGLKAAPISKGNYAGRIGLQDWGSTVWYRNVKLRK